MIPGPRRFAMTLSGVQSSPRIMRGAPVMRPSMVDVPLVMRGKAILNQQGRLGSLSGSTLGDDIDFDDGSITECMRPGEVMTAPGVCMPPGSVSPVTTKVPPSGAGVAAATKSTKPSTQLLVLGAACVGAIFYFGRK